MRRCCASSPPSGSAAPRELIDRLNAIADLEPESHELAVQGYLDSKAFVGASRERERALALLAEAGQGSVQTLLVEGDAGVGRTRFLQELVVVSRLSGALPIVADSASSARDRTVSRSRCCSGCCARCPSAAREVVAEHAALLSNISKELREAAAVCAQRVPRARAGRAARAPARGAARRVARA